MKKIVTTLALSLLVSIPTVFSQPFKDLIPGPHPASSTPEQFLNVGSKMFFVTMAPTYNHQLWVSDGTVAGTILLKDSLIITNLVHPVVPRVDVNGTLYFTVGGIGCSNCETELWKSDGTPGGTVFIDTLFSTLAQAPNHFVALGNNCVFSMGDADGRELWISDGTAAGTMQITDIAPGGTGGVVDAKMISHNNKVYFAASTTLGNYELYSSDGTAGGTALLKEINPSTFASGGSDPAGWVVYNSELYFGADNGADGGIWKTDGTTIGTVEIITPMGFASAQVWNGEMYFYGGTPGQWYPLWKSDGTAGGTSLVRDSAGAITGISSNYIMTSLPTITPPYLPVYKRSDGTYAGTQVVSHAVGTTGSFNTIGANMYITRLDSGTTDVGVWVTDGTAAGTSKLLNGFGTGPTHIYNNAVWFCNYEAPTGYELWTINGPVGIGELMEENNLHIYPNPATENVMVEVSDQTNGTVELINMSGSIVSTQQFNQEKMVLNISHLIPGIYMVRVTTKTGTSVQKLIKN